MRQDVLQAIIKSVSACCASSWSPAVAAIAPQAASEAVVTVVAPHPLLVLQRSYVVYPPSNVTDEKIQEVGSPLAQRLPHS
jgi:hypothetical protein